MGWRDARVGELLEQGSLEVGGNKVVLLGVDGRGEGGCREGCECELHGGEKRKRKGGEGSRRRDGDAFRQWAENEHELATQTALALFVVGLWFGSR